MRAADHAADHIARLRLVKLLVEDEGAALRALAEPPPGGPDAAAFAAFVEAERLQTLAAPALLSEPGRGLLPADVRERIAADVARRAERDAHLRADLRDAHDVLAGPGADPPLDLIVMKGFAHGVLYFGDPVRRRQSDVDLLVRARDRDAALARLRQAGFELIGGFDDPARLAADVARGKVRAELRRGPTTMDLHWDLRRRARRHVREESLWVDTRAFTLDGRDHRTLSDDNALMFKLLGMVGDLRRGACGTRHFLDLHMMLRALEAGTDWEAFLTRRRPQHLLRPCVNVLAVHLAAWDAGRDFPRLARAILSRRRLVELRDAAEAVALVTRPRGAPENKAWFRRVYPFDELAGWARRLTLDLPHALARWRSRESFSLPAESPPGRAQPGD